MAYDSYRTNFIECTESTQRMEKISIQYLEDKHALEIKDTGIGIRSEDIPKIFDRGYSGFNGRMNEKSSGLGLYLARKISERLKYSNRSRIKAIER